MYDELKELNELIRRKQEKIDELRAAAVSLSVPLDTGASLFIQNTRKSYIQNRLNNTPIGILALANNDIDTGLLYTRQNIVAHEAVKKSLSFDDLKRIAQGVNTPDNVTNGHNEPIDSESN